jgi:hypothetical protein
MSKNKDRIIKTLKKYNLEVEELYWEPIGIAFEMCGPEGGWFLRTSKGTVYTAYNINDLINDIEKIEQIKIKKEHDKFEVL